MGRFLMASGSPRDSRCRSRKATRFSSLRPSPSLEVRPPPSPPSPLPLILILLVGVAPHFLFEDKRPGGKRKLAEDPDDHPPAKKVEVAKAPKVEEEDDEMEQNLQCGICQDILYKCASVMPCLHTFCCSCLKDWSMKSTDCPECRKGMKGVNKNHMIQNMVDTYLMKHPQKKRSAQEVAELDPKSDINALAVSAVSSLPFPVVLVSEVSCFQTLPRNT